MRSTELTFETTTGPVPMLAIIGGKSDLSILFLHGYGGNKEEMLPLLFPVAQLGINCYAADLRGHGTNPSLYDRTISDEVASLIEILARYGRVAAVGHSLGGRLALLTRATIRVGISPALSQEYAPHIVETIHSVRAYRVREEKKGINFDILRELPVPAQTPGADDFLLFGTRDVADVKKGCLELREHGYPAVEIAGALHNDIITLPETFRVLRDFFSGRM